ncbi:uncharacterized protein BP5553_02125 [Venustampulla echinocandica]|uniref:BTB domain-containing protein n=1 Tax=Venustampulla echinocandica TaxID=2656787 RepID=A0A370U2Y6_9HELO|nr:uncharacterized protein BP5553_02125 [Venustampulla echinocandica]RDL42146.1 hypothetical protein BP5553_02125 [Venustampulla echinocandica]
MGPPVDFVVTDDMATFIVGPESQVFRIDRNQVMLASPLFHAFFTGEWAGPDKIYTLKQEDPTLFHSFLQWIVSDVAPETEETVEQQMVTNAKLWALGDRFLVPRFQNRVMNRYVDMVMEATVSQLKDLAYSLYEIGIDGESRIPKNVLQWRLSEEDQEALWESGIMSAGLALDQAEFRHSDWQKSDIHVHEI